MQIRFNHYIGGVFLISGTTIGAGMLAIPVATAFLGFVPSLIVFVLIWMFMLASAFFFLDVTLSFEGDVNLITMSGKTLGIWGKIFSWVIYLLLLYSLAAAYIAGSAPLFQNAFSQVFHRAMPGFFSPFCLPVIFGIFIYFGTMGVDLINRVLMCGLIASYFLLIGLAPSHVDLSLLKHSDLTFSLVAIPVILTSFGYHIIIPTLASYMHFNRKHLKRCILIGSLIPLCVYVIWQFLILGTVPLTGKTSLASAFVQAQAATAPLSKVMHNSWLTMAANFFSFFAIVTSFLGVTLSLSDFLVDGLKLKKHRWEGRLGAVVLTFLPPLVFVFFYRRMFLIALDYAGVFVAILLGFIPALMAWHLKKPQFYQSTRGRVLLIATMALSWAIVLIAIMNKMGVFQKSLNKYFLSLGVH